MHKSYLLNNFLYILGKTITNAETNRNNAVKVLFRLKQAQSTLLPIDPRYPIFFLRIEGIETSKRFHFS